MNSGTVFEIERFAVNDGPGIRTVVFLKGCPLRCLWCANPESQKNVNQLMYWSTRCIGCGECIRVCPQGALSRGESGIVRDTEKCILCGACADACNSEAFTVIGGEMSAEQVADIVERDRDFYASSGGGVTFSGGEVMAQPDFLAALAKECKSRGISTCVETSGFAPWSAFEKSMPYIDQYLYDIKCMDPVRHRELTGVPNDIILANFEKLVRAGKPVRPRMPIIPGCNDRDSDMEQAADFLAGICPGVRVDLLPYHSLGVSKYDRLGMNYDLPETAPPSNERMEELAAFFKERGFAVTVGG